MFTAAHPKLRKSECEYCSAMFLKVGRLEVFRKGATQRICFRGIRAGVTSRRTAWHVFESSESLKDKWNREGFHSPREPSMPSRLQRRRTGCQKKPWVQLTLRLKQHLRTIGSTWTSEHHRAQCRTSPRKPLASLQRRPARNLSKTLLVLARPAVEPFQALPVHATRDAYPVSPGRPELSAKLDTQKSRSLAARWT